MWPAEDGCTLDITAGVITNNVCDAVDVNSPRQFGFVKDKDAYKKGYIHRCGYRAGFYGRR